MAKNDILIASVVGIVIVVGLYLVWQNSTQIGDSPLHSIANMFRGWTGQLTSGEEAEQAAMYAQY